MNAAGSVNEAIDQVRAGAAAVVLDFSAFERIDAAALRGLEELARAAEPQAAKIVLAGVHVNVYKVLKLMNLTGAFSFA